MKIGPTRKPTIRVTRTIAFFYKVEKWTKDGSKVDRLLYAGNNLDEARLLFQDLYQTPTAHPNYD